MRTKYLLLHGWPGKHPDKWQTHLAARLKEVGANVMFPDLPNATLPKVKEWREAIETLLEGVDLENLVIVGHSLGTSSWLDYLAHHPDTYVKRAFLVAPPLTDCGINEISNFFPLPEIDLGNEQEKYEIIGSDNDEHVSQRDFEVLAERLKIRFNLLKGAGHINEDSGYGKWDWMEDECLRLLR